MTTTRLLFVLLATFTMTASPAHAQGVIDKLDGVICQPPQCDLRRSLPISVEGPLQAQEELIHLAQNTPVSQLDVRLPHVPFSDWLSLTLQPYVEAGRSGIVNWSLSFCNERRSAVPRAGPDLCIEASLALSAKHSVMVVLAVAEGKSSLDGRTGWRVHEPRVDAISIGRAGENTVPRDSLDVAVLSDLEQQLQKRDDEWPSVDFRTAVTMTPSSWKPGDVVRFTIWVQNVGKRDAERAWVSVLIGVAPRVGDKSIEIRREWFPRVPANGRVAFDLPVRLPRGDAMVHVSARPGPGPTAESGVETNPDDNDTSMVVGTELVKPR